MFGGHFEKRSAQMRTTHTTVTEMH